MVSSLLVNVNLLASYLASYDNSVRLVNITLNRISHSFHVQYFMFLLFIGLVNVTYSVTCVYVGCVVPFASTLT